MKKQARVGLLLVVAILGSVMAAQGETITDHDNYGYYYKIFEKDPGQYTLEFDFLFGISETAGQGIFPDYFAASLYFLESDLGSMTPENFWGKDNLPLIDLQWVDSDYSFQTNSGFAILSNNPDSSTHYTISFLNTYSYIVPTFELFNLNDSEGDSWVTISNITLTQGPASVPEPGAAIPLALAVIGMVCLGRKQLMQ